MSANTAFLKGETIFEEGNPGDRMFRISKGDVLIFKKGAKRGAIPLAKLGPGDIFGEMQVIEDAPQMRSASALAVSDVEVEVYFNEEVREILQTAHPFVNSMISTLNRRLRDMTSDYVSSASSSKKFSFQHWSRA